MAYREKLNCLASRRELENSFLPDRKVCRGLCLFSEPFSEPQSQQAGAISEAPSTWLTCPASVNHQAPYLLLSGLRSSINSSQPRFAAWLHLGISKPSTSSSHLRLLYSSGKVALGKTEVGTDLGLHPPGNPRTRTSSGQLQTMLDHHPVSAQLILHRGWRLVVSGHSQSLQLTDLGKSLPLTCQQQSRLNYRGGCTQPTLRVHL